MREIADGLEIYITNIEKYLNPSDQICHEPVVTVTIVIILHRWRPCVHYFQCLYMFKCIPGIHLSSQYLYQAIGTYTHHTIPIPGIRRDTSTTTCCTSTYTYRYRYQYLHLVSAPLPNIGTDNLTNSVWFTSLLIVTRLMNLYRLMLQPN